MERDGSLDDPTYVVRGASVTEVPGNENVFPYSANLGSLMVLEMLRSVLREAWWPPAPTKFHYTYVSGRLTPQVAECRSSCTVAARTAHGDSWPYPFIDDPVRREDPTSGGNRFMSWLNRRLSPLGRCFRGGRT